MNRVFYEENTFHNQNYQITPLQAGDYENCTFTNCDFTSADLSEINFLDCKFQDCNLSLTKLRQTTLNNIKFKNCKLLGLHFEDCNTMMIKLAFEKCTINLCSFGKLKIKKTIFINSKIEEADFTDTDLGGSVIQDCDLQRTIFHHTNLEGADFTTSFNYEIDPDNNQIKKARFSISGLPGLLGKYGIEIEK